jgi:hypothetical protein
VLQSEPLRRAEAQIGCVRSTHANFRFA